MRVPLALQFTGRDYVSRKPNTELSLIVCHLGARRANGIDEPGRSAIRFTGRASPVSERPPLPLVGAPLAPFPSRREHHTHAQGEPSLPGHLASRQAGLQGVLPYRESSLVDLPATSTEPQRRLARLAQRRAWPPSEIRPVQFQRDAPRRPCAMARRAGHLRAMLVRHSWPSRSPHVAAQPRRDNKRPAGHRRIWQIRLRRLG